MAKLLTVAEVSEILSAVKDVVNMAWNYISSYDATHAVFHKIDVEYRNALYDLKMSVKEKKEYGEAPCYKFATEVWRNGVLHQKEDCEINIIEEFLDELEELIDWKEAAA